MCFPQGYEDWLRHKADNEVNGAPVYVVRSGGLVKTRSKNIRVCAEGHGKSSCCPLLKLIVIADHCGVFHRGLVAMLK